ncbi:TonB-dependent receptor [Sphingomonas paucimobilis]|uniref:TonB-dependent receptor n=1 Tax=Sphingomonas paucimobilis TaxID=13689 RepID=A0A7Y2PD88_SPHPI|nr:TonB-dependent receptor [Sphingomonas paucimobilis]NNG58596.1 TonB-dependent receptor [Sphingomonas paucimobilis]
MTRNRLVEALCCASSLALAVAPVVARAQVPPPGSDEAVAEGTVRRDQPQVQGSPTDAPPRTESALSDSADILVIARGTSETLQKSPASITAFSSRQINDARIKDVSDFIASTPNISIVKSQSAGTSFVTVRGVSQVRNGESPLAVVVDGVQQVSPRQFTGDLFDVQQIEVLRGPQGALYGRNAIGGAIVITSKQPTNDFALNTNLSYGNGDLYRAEAAISGPIVRDKLLFRVAGSFLNFGGLLRNDFLNQTQDKTHDRNIRGLLHAVITDTLTADFRANYSHTDAIGGLFQYQAANFASPDSCFLDPANPFGGPAPDADRVSRRFCSNNRGTNRRTLEDYSFKLQNTADWGTITNVLSRVNVKELTLSDQFPYTASRNVFGTDGTQTQYEISKSWQNDFRVAAAANARFQWLIGGYYLRTNRFISTTTGFDTGQGIIPIYREPQYANALNPTLSFLADNNRNRAYAFYGNLGFKITDALEVSAAFRYDHDRRRQSISPLGSAGVPTGCTTTNDAACVRTANFSQSQPKFTINYKPTDTLTLFADWGIGFRSGQFNQAGAASAANLPGAFDLAKAEKAETAEAGFKASLFDGKLRVNATGFYTNDKNPFYFVFVGSIGAQILVNVDKVRLYGGEIEAYFTPVKGFDLFASYGYTHSEIRRFAFDPTVVGNKAPYIPRDGGSVGTQYRIPMSDRYNLFARAEVEHHGKQYWEPNNVTSRSSFQLVNLRGGVETAGGAFSLMGFARNVTDKKYNAEFVSGGFVAPSQPRTYGVELIGQF